MAHVVGAAVRKVGHTARELDPEHRRDGAGLFLIGLAVVVAAAVWWRLPGDVGTFTRTVVAGSVGLLGWFVPFLLCFVAWRNLRDPEANGPAGRQVIGWAALLFGVLGLVHIANGMPSPSVHGTDALQEAGGALGFVIASLFMDLLRSTLVVVPLLVLMAFFGLLVITATPLYQVPTRLREARDRMLGRTPADEEEVSATEDTVPVKRGRTRRRQGSMADEPTGDEPYATPVLEDRALLGDHIEGSDVRLAIRHPAASEHLAGVEGGATPVSVTVPVAFCPPFTTNGSTLMASRARIGLAPASLDGAEFPLRLKALTR